MDGNPAASPVHRCGLLRAAVSGSGRGGAGPASVLGVSDTTPSPGRPQVEPLPAVAHPGGISPSPLALIFVEGMSYVFFCAVALAGTSGTWAPLLVHPRWSWENTITVTSTHMTQAGTANPHCVTGSRWQATPPGLAEPCLQSERAPRSKRDCLLVGGHWLCW